MSAIYIYLSRVKKRVENVPFVNFNFFSLGLALRIKRARGFFQCKKLGR